MSGGRPAGRRYSSSVRVTVWHWLLVGLVVAVLLAPMVALVVLRPGGAR